MSKDEQNKQDKSTIQKLWEVVFGDDKPSVNMPDEDTGEKDKKDDKRK